MIAHTAPSARGISPSPAPGQTREFYINHTHEVVQALLPWGDLSPDGTKWIVGDVEIQLTGPQTGRCVNMVTGSGGRGLSNLAHETGLPWPETLVRVGEIATGVPVKSNGHDQQEARVDGAASKPVLLSAMNDAATEHLQNGSAANLAVSTPAPHEAPAEPEVLPGEMPRAAPSDEDKQTGRGQPIVRVGGGSLPIAIDQAEAFLINRDGGIYQRGDFVVRPAPQAVTIADERQTIALRLVQVRTQHMIERFTRHVDFQRFNAKEKKWVSIDCPANIAAAYLERTGDWKLRPLSGIANAPTLRPDGSILDQPGYDPTTCLLYDPRGVRYPTIPLNPTKDDARAALAELKSLICEFPFEPDDSSATDIGAPSASRSVALSGMMTAPIRRSLPHAPLHAFKAPAMGTGKSKLVDAASMIASGHEAPVLAQGKTEEEMEKRLGAALIAGDPLISFDNCEHPLGGELLCQALTQPTLSIRILGRSTNVTVRNNAAVFATGNNLVVIGDMTRRTIVCSLDAKVERPETRRFTTEDPVKIVRRNRAKYVAAALTILRAYYVAGQPEQSTEPLGSFEVWSRLVRDALLWLGEPDPCKTMERARTEDPRMQELSAVLHQWHSVIGKTPVTVKDVIERATDYYQQSGPLDLNKREFLHPDFREALLVVAGDGGVINSRRLGTWLGHRKGQVVGNLRIVPATQQNGENRWEVQSVG